MASTAVGMLLVGTRKGVFIVSGDTERSPWTVSEPMFLGHVAQHVVLDPRDGRRLLVAYPGIRFRIVDEQGRLRRHMRVFVNDEMTRDLATIVMSDDEVTLLQALSGG